MCTERKTGSWLPIVKNVVDSVYDYLAPHPDGITMSAKEYGKRGARVCSKMVERGIIEKKSIGRGKGWRYKYVATMGPTQVLYGSIAQELFDEDLKYSKTYISKKKASKKAASENIEPKVEVAEQQAPVLEPVKTPREYVSDLKGFSAQELWDELKGRGYFIEDNRLAIVKTAYLD